MTMNISILISGSVGKSGVNRPDDLRKVRQRLNDIMPLNRNKLNLNSPIGHATYDAIYEFQKIVCGFNRPDSRIDPNKSTIRLLNDPRSRDIWAGDPFANSCANFDVQALNLRASIQSHHPSNGTGAQLNNQQLTQLRAELASLEAILRRRYPDGRPSGASVLAVVAPGKYTLGALQEWGRLINNLGHNYGSTTAITVTLASPIVVPILVGVFGVADFIDLLQNPRQAAGPNEYDRIMREIRSARGRIQSAAD